MLKRYRIYTGPCIVSEIAARLQYYGFVPTLEGTEHVYVASNEGSLDDLMRALGPSFLLSDIAQLRGDHWMASPLQD